MAERLPDDLRDALSRFIEEERPGMTMQAAILYALRDWCITNSLLPATPSNGIENARKR